MPHRPVGAGRNLDASISTVMNHSIGAASNNGQCGQTSTANTGQIGNNARWALGDRRFSCNSSSQSQLHMSYRGGQVVFCRCHRSRGRDAFDELRGRSGFPPSCRARGHPLHQGAAGPANRPRPMRRPASRSVSSQGRDIPQEWWALFKSPALNALIERVAAKQSQPAIGAGDAARRASKPFTPRRASSSRSSRPISIRRASGPPLRSLRSPLPAPAFSISTPRRCWCPTRSTSGASIGARWSRSQAHGRHAALPGRGGLPRADVERRGRSHHRGVAARPDRRHQSAHRDQYAKCSTRCSASWTPAMPTAATWPRRRPRWRRPRRRCRRCARRWRSSATSWRRLSGGYPSEGPRETFRLADLRLPRRSAGEPAVAIDRAAPGRARGGGAIARGERAGRRRHRQHAAELHHQRQRRLHEYGARRICSRRRTCSGSRRQRHADDIRRRHAVPPASRAPRTPIRRRRGPIAAR